MTFVLSTAAGAQAVTDLRASLGERVAHGEVAWIEHAGQAVAWDTTNGFITSSDDGDVLVVLDGLLHELFDDERSQADLLRRRYRQRGTDLAVDLLGDFVAVVLDRRRRTLLVARDPIGVRPWYQATSGRRHSGATDQATLCTLPWVDTGVDERMALAYVAFASRSTGPTFHRGIETLPPGHTWVNTPDGSSVRRHHSWRIDLAPRITWADAIDRCRELVDEAVRSRLRVAGSSSSELSGGLDSSSIVGTAVLLGQPPLVGRLLFEGRSADERTYSDAVIEHWDLAALSIRPWIPSLDELTALTIGWRRPVPDANFTMFADLYRAFAEVGHRYTMTGLGGDDIFIAMSYETRVLSAVRQGQWGVLSTLMRTSLRHPRHAWTQTWRPTLRRLTPRARPRAPRYISQQAIARHDLGAHFTWPPRLTGVPAVDERAVNLTTGHTAFILELRALVTDLTASRNTHPLLDPRVIEGLYGLDPWLPVRDGHGRALESAAFVDRLPPAVANRRSKAEFSEVFWPQTLTAEVLERVTSGPLVERGWLDLGGFQNILNGAREGRAWAALPLSRAVEVDRWLRQPET
ncbi:asparagine synthase-related protein [Streptomyces sp.]|uniref:asparagine synthase-related protein n=1 Tax=Streptomyces sp. TaxID=1931 RepID=UPI002D7FFB94|nr:asparagine synthase-related protein [Streptomyces sp.]